MDINELEQILALLKRNEVTEFELKEGATELKLTRLMHSGVGRQEIHHQLVSVQPAVVSDSTMTQIGNAAASGSVSMPQESDKFFKVESPIVGTFYRKPSPDSEAFVREGDRVKAGDTLCIVEAMKLMNEIESPCSGKIEKILVSDGEVVEYGEVVMLINPE